MKMERFGSVSVFKIIIFYCMKKNQNILKSMQYNQELTVKIYHRQEQINHNLKNIQTNTSHNHSSENLKNQPSINSDEYVKLTKKTDKSNEQIPISQNNNSIQAQPQYLPQNLPRSIPVYKQIKIQHQNKSSQIGEQSKQKRVVDQCEQRFEQLYRQIVPGRINQIHEKYQIIQQHNNVLKMQHNKIRQHQTNMYNQVQIENFMNSEGNQQKDDEMNIQAKDQNPNKKEISNQIQSSSSDIHNSINLQVQTFKDNLKIELNQQNNINDWEKEKFILPIGWGYLLEMTNLSYIFPGIFKFNQNILKRVLTEIQQNKQSSSQLSSVELRLNSANINAQNKNLTNSKIDQILKTILSQPIRQFMRQLTIFMLQDLTVEKLQNYEKSKSLNLVCLSKFCQENQFFDFVFRYNWPLIINQIITMSQIEHLKTDELKNKNQVVQIQYLKSLQQLKNCIQRKDNQISKNIQISLEMVSLILDCFTRTNLFREMFTRKLETSRSTSKRRSQLEDEKKNLQQLLKKLNSQQNKKTKKITKNLNKNKDNLKIQQNHKIDKVEQIQKIQREIQDIINLIEQQNNQQNILSCCAFLGRDSKNHIYWYVKHFTNLIFVEKSRTQWFIINNIKNFLQTLKIQNYNQSKLMEKITQFYKQKIAQEQKSMHEMEIQHDLKSYKDNFDLNSKFSTDNLCESKQQKKLQMEVEKILLENHHDDNDFSRSSSDSYGELTDGLEEFNINKNSLFRMVEVGQRKMSEYLKQRNSKWGNQAVKQLLFSTIKQQGPNWLEQAKKQLSIFNEKICVVEIQYKVYVQQSSQQVDSKIKKIQTKIWGINQKYKHNWYDFMAQCTNFFQLFYGVCILYNLIKKYTSKNRKLRKEYQQIKLKTTHLHTQAKKQWIKNLWSQQCQVCGHNGQVLCCDYCPKVYHLNCINMNEIPSEQFKCKSCKEQVTTRNQLKSLSETKKPKKK